MDNITNNILLPKIEHRDFKNLALIWFTATFPTDINLLEYEEKQGSDIEVLIFDAKKIIKLARAKDLLPFYFQEDKLKRI